MKYPNPSYTETMKLAEFLIAWTIGTFAALVLFVLVLLAFSVMAVTHLVTLVQR